MLPVCLRQAACRSVSVAPEVDTTSELISKVPPTIGVGVEGKIGLDNSDKHLTYFSSNTSQIRSAERLSCPSHDLLANMVLYPLVHKMPVQKVVSSNFATLVTTSASFLSVAKGIVALTFGITSQYQMLRLIKVFTFCYHFGGFTCSRSN